MGSLVVLVLGVFLNIEHVILLQLDVLIITVLLAWHGVRASPRVLLGRVEAVVEHAVPTGELHNLVQVHLGGPPLLFLLLADLRIPAHMLVLHALCANSDAALVLQLHRNALLLAIHALTGVSVNDSSD